MSRPLLVLVSGAPGAGKTTLARQLAPMLQLPLVAKDDIKESMADALGETGFEWSKRLGGATMDIIWILMERFAQANASAMFESNFYPDLCGDRISGFAERFGVVLFEIHCTSDAKTLAARVNGRARHAIHHSNDPSVETMEQWMHLNRALELNEHVLRVDTTGPEPVDLEAIVAKVREAGSGL
jgi:predicted kinase